MPAHWNEAPDTSAPSSIDSCKMARLKIAFRKSNPDKSRPERFVPDRSSPRPHVERLSSVSL